MADLNKPASTPTAHPAPSAAGAAPLALPELAANGQPRRPARRRPSGRAWRLALGLAGLLAMLLWLANLAYNWRRPAGPLNYPRVWQEAAILAILQPLSGPASVTPDGQVRLGPASPATHWVSREPLGDFELELELLLGSTGERRGGLWLATSTEPASQQDGSPFVVLLDLAPNSLAVHHAIQMTERHLPPMATLPLPPGSSPVLQLSRLGSTLRVRVNEQPWQDLVIPAVPFYLGFFADADATLTVNHLRLAQPAATP